MHSLPLLSVANGRKWKQELSASKDCCSGPWALVSNFLEEIKMFSEQETTSHFETVQGNWGC